MGYTKIAGTPVVTGLYTLLLPLAAFALLGSSRHLVVGADSATAAMLFAGLVGQAEPFSGHWLMLASATALVTAALLAAASVLRLGLLADFLSRTVLVGFLGGVGITVMIGVAPDMLGLPVHAENAMSGLAQLVAMIPGLHVPTVVMATSVLATIICVDRLTRTTPGALVALALATAATWILRLESIGIAIVGPLQAGFPALQVPRVSLSDVMALVPIAASMFLVIVAQSAATARSFAQKNGETVDENRDFLALAVSNAVAGFSSTFVVNGSPTKTAIAELAGARSKVAHLTAAVVVLGVLLVAMPLVAHLPVASLAALVFLVGARLVDLKAFSQIYRFRRRTFLVAAATMVAVIVVGVERGMFVAILLSILDHLRQEYRPKDIVVTRAEDRLVPANARGGVETEPGLIVYRFEAPLFFANADHLVSRVLDLVTHAPHPVRWFIFDLVSMNDIDYTGGLALASIVNRLQTEGVVVGFTAVDDVRSSLDWLEATQPIGPVRIFESVPATVDAYRRELPPPHH
jgi:SulP family sulfate permease